MDEAHKNGIIVNEIVFDSDFHGLYKNSKIVLNKNKHSTTAEKACTMAEELGDHYKSSGNILDDRKINNRKQEYKARLYAYDKLIGLRGLVNAFNANCKNIYEMAEYLDVTPKFLADAIECYRSKYGLSAKLDNYGISFDEEYKKVIDGIGFGVYMDI